jgi:hypothetical protein
MPFPKIDKYAAPHGLVIFIGLIFYKYGRAIRRCGGMLALLAEYGTWPR